MRRRSPLLIQVLAGNLVTTLPLLAGLAVAIVTLQANTEQQQRLMVEGETLTRIAVSIGDQLRQLERAVRQHRVLRDEQFGGVVDLANRQTLMLLQQAEAGLPQEEPDTTSPVAELRHRLEEIPSLLQRGTPDTRVVEFFADTGRLGSSIRSRIDATLDARLAEEEARVAKTRQLLILLAILASAFTVMTALIVTMLVARPLRRLSGSIHHLGMGEWNDSIAIEGPSDISELGTRLEWLRGQLIAGERERIAFARNVTHELKTPLAAVMEAAALLEDGIPGPVTPRQHDVLALLQENAAALQKLIEQLLRYNSAVRGTGAVTEPYPLREVVEESVAQVLGRGAVKEVRTEVEGEELWCRIDRHRLQLALGNLLSNAMDHSPPHGLVSLEWQRQAELLVLSVTDDGDGVAEEDAEKIFKPFYTAKPRGPAGERGTGLGLTIALECAERIGGRISVRNAPGRGACFQLVLPLSAAAMEAA